MESKQPFCFEVQDGAVFAFAGLWDRWRAQDGNVVETCTILTTTPNDLLADVHGRMPVILPTSLYERWLDPTTQNVAGAVTMLQPFDAKSMRHYAVSTRVNNAAHGDEECSRPVQIPEGQTRLFA